MNCNCKSTNMCVKLMLAVIVILLTAVRDVKSANELEGDEVCYTRVGCFNMTKPWRSKERPIPPPMDPKKIGVVPHFYSRQFSTGAGVKIGLDPEIDMKGADFDRQKRTFFIVHGWLVTGQDPWMLDLKDTLLRLFDANIFLIDWRNGSRTIRNQAVGNTRLVAREMVILAKFLQIDPSNTHVIGHSQGGQVSGDFGSEMNGAIQRITGLDASGIRFENYDPIVRLDPTDAQFVDAIHTNIGGLGYIGPIGHVDFYVNGGGFGQPGCVTTFDITDFIKLVTTGNVADFSRDVYNTEFCPHSRAIKYFLEAVKNRDCTFWGRPESFEAIMQSRQNQILGAFGIFRTDERSPQCNKMECVPLGLDTFESPLRGTFAVSTHATEPFCIPQATGSYSIS